MIFSIIRQIVFRPGF